MKKFFILVIVLAIVSSIYAQSTNKKVAIIGAGMSGVSAAHYIRKIDTNAEITIFEKEKSVGGNAKTIAIDNNGKKVYVDLGPQYFTQGPWDDYIALLKEYGLFNEAEISKFIATISVQNLNREKADFISPKGGSLRGENPNELMQFLKFYSEARKAYIGKESVPEKIGDWVVSLGLREDFKTNVVLPFLASTLGTSIENIKETSTKHIVSLFAFNPALEKSEFSIFDKGMGNILKSLAAKVQQKNVSIKTNSKVVSVDKQGEKYILTYENNGTQTKEFDFVVFAIHPDHASAILRNNKDAQLLKVIETLNKFRYFGSLVVLHRDDAMINKEKESFFNIKTDGNNKIYANSMNLGVINSDLKGIYRTLMNADALKRVKSNNTFIHQEFFFHPLITPKFVNSAILLKSQVKSIKNLYFAGGWSEGLETQNTATISGKNAAEKYRLFVSK